MKPKYNGLVSLGIIGAALAVAIGYMALGPAPVPAETVRGLGATFPEIHAPSIDEIREMRLLAGQLDRLGRPGGTAAQGGELSFAVFGFTDRRGEPLGGNDSEEAGKGMGLHVLTMAFSTGSHGFCVIDGIMYTQGDVLPDGAVLRQVKSDGVLLGIDDIVQWLPLEPRS